MDKEPITLNGLNRLEEYPVQLESNGRYFQVLISHWAVDEAMD